MPLTALRIDDAPKLVAQLRKVVLQHVPHDIVIDVEVVVDQHIPHPCDIRPIHMRVLLPQLER